MHRARSGSSMVLPIACTLEHTGLRTAVWQHCHTSPPPNKYCKTPSIANGYYVCDEGGYQPATYAGRRRRQTEIDQDRAQAYAYKPNTPTSYNKPAYGGPTQGYSPVTLPPVGYQSPTGYKLGCELPIL